MRGQQLIAQMAMYKQQVTITFRPQENAAVLRWGRGEHQQPLIMLGLL
jgi:hypothetical protein